MEESSRADVRLITWKEIASYLRVSIRTAQMWEKEKGLPVRRSGGPVRPRVSATVDDLEAWMNELHDPGATHLDQAFPVARTLLIAAILAVAALAVWLAIT